MNLQPTIRKEKSPYPLWLSFFGFFFAAVIYIFMPGETLSVRALEVEEREVVISVLNRVTTELPQDGEWAEDFTAQFIENGIPAFVDPSAASQELVRNKEDSLFFQPAFFQADAIAQQNSLAKVVLTLKPALTAIPGADLAIKKH